MKTSMTKKLTVVLLALILVVISAACNNAPQTPDASPTMAPENPVTDEQNAEVTAEPTPTPDPLAPLNYWKLDPDKKIYNILLLGMGQEEPGQELAHNDTTMILQVNLETNEMKLVSFMRDMIVDIRGEQDRINNTHLIGGPKLVRDTMKSVFGVDIDYYASVNFITFEQIMRVIGTIKIDVQEYEVEHLKKAESAVSIEGEMIGGQGVVQNEGTYDFNEYLALSYARDRHSGRVLDDGTMVYNDRGRNERQRKVIIAAWDKVKTKPLSLIPPSVFLAMPYVETDMNEALIINLLKLMMESDAQISDMSVPESNWPEWKAKTGEILKNDELEDIYNQKKAAYEAANQPTEPAESSETPAATQEVEAFPTFERWRQNEGYASVIGWSHNSTIRDLHEFLGID